MADPTPNELERAMAQYAFTNWRRQQGYVVGELVRPHAELKAELEQLRTKVLDCGADLAE